MQTRLGPPKPGEEPFRQRDGFIDHPWLKPGTIEARDYQLNLARAALATNTLVVVPTGLGKTVVAGLVIAERLRQGGRKVLVVAPTRPLAVQHHGTLTAWLRDEGLVHLLGGSLAPNKRAAAWTKALVVVSTPETIRNDLDHARYDLKTVDLVVFDEAHRAVGDYAYVSIGQQLRHDNPRARVLGLTASPGAKRERLLEVQSNLDVQAVEARDQESDDVAEFAQRIDVDVRMVETTATIRRVAKPFHEILREKEDQLRSWNLIRGKRAFGLTKKELIMLQQTLAKRRHFAALNAAAMAHYARLCADYVEVYGLGALQAYLNRMESKAKPRRYEVTFLKDPRVRRARSLLEKGFEVGHPKESELVRALDEAARTRADFLAIVFVQYRDALASILDSLKRAGITAQRFVGQASREGDEGLNQESQRDVLRRFSQREFRVLVSTSVGEEGIDVPQVDLVVFYDAVPSEIRSIQRRGRTGRTVAGRAVVLVAAGTSDEGAYYASRAREKKMRKLVSRHGTK